MKVALVHDHLAQDGGAEKVLRVFQEMFPDAPTFVLVYDPQRTNSAFQHKDIRTSFIQRFPWGIKHYQWYLPFMPTATESFNLDGFDVVLSSSSMFAKGVITQPETLHISYCHTPTRYLWSDSHRYLSELHIPKILKKMTPFLLTQIRMWDYLAAARADHMVANSSIVRERIQKYYGRESVIITPPVDVEQFEVGTSPGNYFLAGGRLVAYKRLDIVIKRLIGFAVRSKFSATDRSENTSRRARKAHHVCWQSFRRGIAHAVPRCGCVYQSAGRGLWNYSD